MFIKDFQSGGLRDSPNQVELPAGKTQCSKKLFDSQEMPEDKEDDALVKDQTRKRAMILSPNTLVGVASQAIQAPIVPPKCQTMT